VETAHEVLVALARRYAFGDVAALVGAGAAGTALTTRDGAQVEQLCAFGQQLLDLDAEDFGNPDAARDANTEHGFADRVTADAVPPELVSRARACRMPQDPREKPRGALASLVPAFGLLLEVIAARWTRRETVSVVAAIHITSEYLPVLAWESTLGHAADPARLGAAVNGDGSRWGDFDDRECEHTRPERSAAHHAVRVVHESPGQWRTYLDRQHSNVAHALAVCAGECRRPCPVVTRYPAPAREELRRRCRTALVYATTPVVQLRHSAPVGHGFGVPSTHEVRDAWVRSRAELARLEPAVLAEDGYPLPGLPSLFSAVAGRPVVPDTLVADTAAALLAALA
jgi:hypothetical protein